MFSSSLSFSAAPKPPIWSFNHGISWRERKRRSAAIEAAGFSYQKFVNFALDETKRRVHLVPSSLQALNSLHMRASVENQTIITIHVDCLTPREKLGSIPVTDGKAELKLQSFEAPKIRLLRSMCINGNEAMQVMDFAVFPKVEYDLPIFCANFFTSSAMNIIVLDLNPLHDVISNREYFEKYYERLMPLGLKYEQLLPWGGKITSESLRFFSPIVIWTKFSETQAKHNALFAAFKDYYEAWLELMDQVSMEMDASRVMCNCEAQHRYLTWRAEKDPGRQILKKLIGKDHTKDLLRIFLFNGVDELGSKTFLDYFPEYKLEDGTVNDKRSIMGKSFENRPWNSKGEFIGTNF